MLPASNPLTALKAGLAALALMGALLGAAEAYGNRLERHSIHLVTHQLNIEQDKEAEQPAHIERMEKIKNQGMSLLRRALQQPDLVSLYGSSELRKPIPDKAGIFFSHYPTGFAVFQVGKAGATSIILLEKIAASAPASGPRRVAISLSPSWFLGVVEPRYYAGNFSHQQALAVLFSPRLSFELKHLLAHRMEDFPSTLPAGSLLAFTVDHLSAGTARDRFLYWLSTPVGVLQNAVYAAQDRFETSLYILTQRRHWDPEVPRETKTPDWPALLAEAARQSHELSAAETVASRRNFASDGAMLEAMDHSPEWSDFELLLRTFQELGFEPLVLSIPPEGKHFEKMGISLNAMLEYSRRIHTICDRYGARVETFDDHIDDRSFLTDHHDHLSIKGWMYYNKALDDYFHRRHPRAGGAG